ncbi:MAG: polysaccharide biosynthesis/export family protein [Prosthecobacter sp.]|nr:polysaccharide biosynthesis/export family protein [Prosthecobacter sp.]
MISILAVVATLATPIVAQNGELPLRPGDRITVSVGGIPDNEIAQIRGVYTVGDDGTIPLLYIGNVRASGLKPSALQRAIEQRYISEEIYTRPTVVVSIDGGESTATMRTVMVTGVNKPGAVPYKQGMTLSQAIMTAGGPTPFGNMRKVKLIRAGRAPTVHNLSSSTGDPSVDVPVQPDDQIIVPE